MPRIRTLPADGRIERDANGAVVYAWKRRTPALDARQEAEFVKDGRLKPEECLWRLQDAGTGAATTRPATTNADQPVLIAGGSVYWNEYRRKWVLIGTQLFGRSVLGEVWFAEAPTPLGPWRRAVKVATHENYDFYNPKQHPEFAQDGGRVIYFEGTYAITFSGNKHPTPRYEYNQLLYRLDLSDARLGTGR